MQKRQRGPGRSEIHRQGLKASLALARLTRLVITPDTTADSDPGARDLRH